MDAVPGADALGFVSNGAKKSFPPDMGVLGDGEGGGTSRCARRMSVRAETSGRGRLYEKLDGFGFENSLCLGAAGTGSGCGRGTGLCGCCGDAG